MKSNETIDIILNEHKEYLGRHFDKYRNHVYRVFALCMALDQLPNNKEKYAISSAFHDLGIWTSKTFDYLEPSITLAKKYLYKIDRSHWTDEVSLMIEMHHKRSNYTGSFKETVDIFRRADWIDVTLGRLSFGLDIVEYEKIRKAYPNLGFHKFLVVQTLKNFLKSPLNPLPMFKK